MAKSLGYITIYNNNGDIVYQHKGSSGDYAVTVSLNNNIITLRSSDEFVVDPPQVEPIETDPEFPEYVDPFSTVIDTGEVSVSNIADPISLKIVLPYNASKIRYFGGNSGSFADEVYIEGYEDLIVNQGESITTAESNYSSGGGCAIQYYEASTPKVSVDLTTLPGWSDLSDGNHNITIVAKANGYLNSERSSAVVVTKATTPTEDELAGTWVFNDTINFSALSTEDEFDFSWIVNYNVSDDSRDFVQMDTNRMSREDEEGNPILGGNINYIPYSTGIQEPIVAYQFEGDLSMWGSDSYKTIAITSKLSEVTNGDMLLAWLQANATKQEI